MTAETSPTSAAEVAFRELSEREWAWRTDELGAQHYWTSDDVDAMLPDVTPDAWQRRAEHWRGLLDRLAEIDADELSHRARVDLAVYRDQLRALVAQVDHRMYEWPANADSAFWTDHSGRARRTFAGAEQAERFLAQLEQLPRWFAQHIENMRAGVRRGFGPARVAMIGRSDPVRAVAEAPDAGATPYLAPFEDLPPTLPAALATGLRERAAAVVDRAVIPAYRDLLRFLTEEYLPHLPEALAASDRPGGRDLYLAQLREFTTTGLTPEEIHEIGLAEVAAIRAEMTAVAREAGFDGDVAGMHAYMRTDPRFYATTPEELLKEAAWQAKAFDGVVHRYFGVVPRTRFGIVEPPPDLAPYYTFGRGGRDRYTLNTYNLPARPLHSLPALTLHEAAPGHSFQTSLAYEQPDNPPYRRAVYISAYGEGWALYCERLGVEMGMYTTPFETMGMLSFQMWRAARLVIDPGIHALGWTRERAQAYLRDHTAIAEHEIVTEVDRYIAWPGQAASYHLGQLTILGLRRRAEEALGRDFDLRRFHDVVLGLGSVPLDVLEAEVGRDLAARVAARAASATDAPEDVRG